MVVDHLFHFDRGDVLAARDNDVLFAVANLEIAVGMHYGIIAGVEPAAGEGLGGGLGIVVVADHDVVAAHDHLTHGLAVGGDVVHVFVH